MREALGQVDRHHGIGQVLEQDCELVRAEARCRVVDPHRVDHPRGDLLQDLVAGRVAEAVVDGLEIVEVEEHDGDARGLARGDGKRVLDAVGEERTVGQAGDRVVKRLVRKLLLEGRALAHIAAVEHDAAHVRIVEQIRGGDLELERAPVAVDDRAVERLRPHGARTRSLQQRPQASAIGRHEQVLEAGTEHVVGREAEDPLDRGALVDHDTLAIHDGDQIARVAHERRETRLVLAPVHLIGECCALECQRDARAERAERLAEDRRERRRGRRDQKPVLILAHGEGEDVGVETGWESELGVDFQRELDALLRCRRGSLEQGGGRG